MRLLNLHPEVFISNESDIVWILYNFHKGIPIKPYPHDSPGGFQAAIKTAESILDKNLSPLENYERFQKHLMRNGFLKMKGVEKEKLSYIGDQKPYQNIDPELMPFILELFPNAKFLHILELNEICWRNRRSPMERYERVRDYGQMGNARELGA